MLERCLQPVAGSLRRLNRNRGISLLVILSLAVGIGANTAIFTLVDAVFLEPLKVRDPHRIVSVVTVDPRNPGLRSFSFPNFSDLKCRSKSFMGLTASTDFEATAALDGNAKRVEGQLVTPEYFATAGIAPVLGSAFSEVAVGESAETMPVVIGKSLWMSMFGGRQDVVGQTLLVNKTPFTVRGVMPAGFRGFHRMGATEIWVPMAAHSYFLNRPGWVNSRRALMFTVYGRLKDGVNYQRAAAEVDEAGKSLAGKYPVENSGRTFGLMPVDDVAMGTYMRQQLLRMAILLMSAAGLVLLIAIANVGNALLARASVRRREMAVHIALGATNRQLLGQVFWDSLVVVAVGGLLGFLLGIGGRNLLWLFRPEQWAQQSTPHLNWRILAFVAVLSLITGMLGNLLPAWQTLRGNITRELRERSEGGRSGQPRYRLREALVISQVALSMIALVGADLFLKSLRNAESLDAGFEMRNLAALTIDPRGLGTPRQSYWQVYDEIEKRVREVPGVQSVSLSATPPFMPEMTRRTVVPEPGRGPANVAVGLNMVAPGFFETTDILILRGRDIAMQDDGKSAPVAIVNESMARRFWPDEDAVGQSVRFFGDQSSHRVIGVARDTANAMLGEATHPTAYVPIYQELSPVLMLNIRTAGQPELLERPIAETIRAYRRDFPVKLMTASAAIENELWSQRIAARLLAVFALMALALAAVGVYGITANLVTRRTGEIGVRMAMGACPIDVMELVMRQCVTLIVPGLGIGAVLSFALARGFQKMLYGVSEMDLEPYLATAILLAAVALLASYLPARRVTRLAPLMALRQE